MKTLLPCHSSHILQVYHVCTLLLPYCYITLLHCDFVVRTFHDLCTQTFKTLQKSTMVQHLGFEGLLDNLSGYPKPLAHFPGACVSIKEHYFDYDQRKTNYEHLQPAPPRSTSMQSTSKLFTLLLDLHLYKLHQVTGRVHAKPPSPQGQHFLFKIRLS